MYPVNISLEIIREIAGQLDMGMKRFYHFPAGKLDSFPDELKGNAGLDEEWWEYPIKKVKKIFGKWNPFQNFKQLLLSFPDLQQQWVGYKYQCFLI